MYANEFIWEFLASLLNIFFASFFRQKDNIISYLFALDKIVSSILAQILFVFSKIAYLYLDKLCVSSTSLILSLTQEMHGFQDSKDS